MLDGPSGETPPQVSQKTLNSPHIRRIGWEMAKGLPVQDAIKVVREKLAKRLVDPFYVEERQRRIEKEKELNVLLENSEFDVVTGLYNRGTLDGNEKTSPPRIGILEQEIDRMLRSKDKGQKSLTVAMFDIDF